ncbi:MAG TPA: phosphatidate cytidylyltransferase [Chitinophagaceae bacterium]|nr:phosphatidate cytidylyltransferase [Chitinophagaceae bacterium]
MAFNLQTFKTRALTSVVFVVIMLAGIFISKWTFLLLFSVIHFGCWVEYQKLVSLIDPAYAAINKVHKYAAMLAGWGFLLWMTTAIYNIQSISLHHAGKWLCIIMLAVMVAAALFNKPFKPKLIARSILGLVYISLSWGLLINLYCRGIVSGADFGWIIIIMLIGSIWINDTMAYIVGSFIGKTPLSSISPKKTWEGTIGGALLAVITVSLVSHFVFDIDYVLVAILSAIAVTAGTIGDLLESKLKRMANVKDSGQIMPGHGGFLDRFDSLLLATPFAWLYLYLVQHFI